MQSTMQNEKLVEKLVPSKAPLLEKIREFDLTRVFIGLGACVDPDGLASQYAMRRIIETINPEAKISCFYQGDFDRSQNRTMREVLNLNPKPYEEFKDDGYTCLIMVDGPASVMPQACRIANPAVDGVKWTSNRPHFIIDHHEKCGDPIIGEDVRMIGSCSAIMWEYLMALNPKLLEEGEDGAKLATALCIGISTDTVEKTSPKTSQLDWMAEGHCGMHCDVKMYAAIKNYPRPSYQKDMEMAAWKDRKIEGTCLVSPIGVISKQRKGVISSVAEEFCGQGPVRTTLAAGMINGDMHFSFRSFDNSHNADDFIKKTLKANGGGKPGAGAGIIPMPAFCKNLPEELQKEVFRVLFKALCQKMFEFAGDGVRIKEKEETNG